MAAAGVREELTCPLCREIYRDPVTLPCGHNYCRVCIGGTWDRQEGTEEERSSPECRERFPRCPNNVSETFLPVPLEREGVGIFCTYCARLVPAAKSCLHCEASLCDYHVREHSRAAEHVLTDPTASFGHRKCSEHKKILEFYCPEDGACICAFCLAGEHRGHNVELLSEASEKKQEKLRNVLYGFTSVRDRAERRVQNLQERRRKVQENAAEERQRASGLLEEIRDYLRAVEERVMRDISQEETYHLQILSSRIHQLEIKKDELSGNIRHIEELCNMADPLTVLRAPEPDGAEPCSVNCRRNGGRTGDGTNDPSTEGQNLGLASQKLLRRLSGIVSGIRGQEDRASPKVPTSLDSLPANITEIPVPAEHQDYSSFDSSVACGATGCSANNRGNPRDAVI
ncbi:hypothetical protein XENTR_v10022793 [Xenopus tropicalis]|nr:hypothetical protein XENTR_v10022793 [Xenopus tropicalis]